jgi:hypothetical protein
MVSSLPAPLPIEAAQQLCVLRFSLERYQDCGRVAELDTGFAAAAAVVAGLRDAEPSNPQDASEVARLRAQLPAIDELLRAAGDAAEHSMRAGAQALWTTLDLRSEPPSWDPVERKAADVAFACALASPGAGVQRLRAGLTRLASARWAALLLDELGGGEGVWVRALGERYPSVRHRCAPRKRWSDRGLAPLAREDERSRQGLSVALKAWLSDGADFQALPAALEAALVHARTPARHA